LRRVEHSAANFEPASKIETGDRKCTRPEQKRTRATKLIALDDGELLKLKAVPVYEAALRSIQMSLRDESASEGRLGDRRQQVARARLARMRGAKTSCC
jgi:hypothetical protein